MKLINTDMNKFTQTLKIIEEGLLKPQSEEDMRQIKESEVTTYVKENVKAANSAVEKLKSIGFSAQAVPIEVIAQIDLGNGAKHNLRLKDLSTGNVDQIVAYFKWKIFETIKFAKELGFEVD